MALDEILEDNNSANESSSTDESENEKVVAHCDEIPLIQRSTSVTSAKSEIPRNGVRLQAKDAKQFVQVLYVILARNGKKIFFFF